MDDHHHRVKAYDRVRRGRIVGAVGVAGLALVVGLLGFQATQNWDARFERVFEPLPGLLYAPPTQDVSLTTEDNPIPLAFQPIDRSDAYRFNASIPVSSEPLEPAAPFVLPKGLSAVEQGRAISCLTQVVYYEAGSEGVAGQRAVAQVVLNRMRHPAFPSSVCGVVYSGSQRATGCQFTFTCDGSLARPPSAGGWARAREVALAALSGYVYPGVGQATHYHALYVAPYWSPSLLKVANIGAHTFYRWKGFNGRRASFVSPYAGHEPVVSGRAVPEAEPDGSEVVSVEILNASPDSGSNGGPDGGVAQPPSLPETLPATVPQAANARPSGSGQAAPAPTAGPTTAPAAPVTTASPERARRRVAQPDW